MALDGVGRVVLSTTGQRAKARNLRRDPRVSACVFTRPFFGPWVQIAGAAQVLPPAEGLDSEAVKNLYQALSQERPDWEDFQTSIYAQERVVVRFSIERATGIIES